MLKDLIQQVEKHPQISVYKSSEIASFSGHVGNFKTKIAFNNGITSEISHVELKHGAVIVATGGVEHRPEEYLYGQNDAVITQTELEEAITDQVIKPGALISVVMIQCVGSREKNHMYC